MTAATPCKIAWVLTAAHAGASCIAAHIRDWDTKDADRLVDMLQALTTFCDGNDLNANDYVDLACLPSADIPSDVDTSYPIWAMDLENNLVVGETPDDLSTLPLAEYREDRAED